MTSIMILGFGWTHGNYSSGLVLLILAQNNFSKTDVGLTLKTEIGAWNLVLKLAILCNVCFCVTCVTLR